MEWKRINPGQDESYWLNFYNDTELFKDRFTYGYGGYTVSYTTDLVTLSVHIANGAYDPLRGITDNITNTIHTSGMESFDFTEFISKAGAEIYAFRSAATPTHYLTLVFVTTSDGTNICLHFGTSISEVKKGITNTDKAQGIIDLLSLTTLINSNNNNHGEKYIVQPLYIYDEPTPLLTICGNTELAPFTLIQIQMKKFLVVGNGVCVEID